MPKKIFIFLITIPLIVFGFLILNFKRAEKIEAQAWLSDWSYRKSHIINAASGAGTNYQVKIVVWSGTGTDSGGNVYLNNNALNWPNDIRFTDDDGTTLLDHWLESSDANKATFWVEVKDDLSTTNQTIYIYYGKSGESSASNGANTFNFFDDFPGTSLDAGKWTAYANNYSVSSSILRINVGGIERTSAFPFNIQNGYMAETRVKHEVSAANYGGVLPEVASSPYTAGSNANADATILYMRNAGSNTVYYWIGNGSAASYNVGVGSTGWTPTTGTWYITGISVKSGTVKLWRNRAVGNTFSGITWAKNITYVKLGSFHRDAAYDIQDTSYDWVLVRKYTDPEPSPGAWGNVSGWAWSENIGWISFNCSDRGTCGTVDYGVNIDETTGDFSGYAWSRGTTADIGGIGWISFNQADLVGCPSGTCQAELDLVTYEVSGWARAYRAIEPEGQTLGGWEGWIKLRGWTTEAVPTEYGVSLNPATKEFEGWAWGGDPQGSSEAVVGWISFNCVEGGYDEGTGTTYSVCGTSDYKVITSLNFPPYIEAGTATRSDPEPCLNSPKTQIGVQWKYKDDDGDWQSEYDLQVATKDFGDPTFNPATDIIVDYTTSQSVAPNNYGSSDIKVVPPPANPGNREIPYTGATETRYWRVRVREVLVATGKRSGWEVGSSFTIPPHAYPRVDFNRCPLSPSVDETIQFCSVYETGVCEAGACPLPTPAETTCYDADGICDIWEWDFNDDGVIDSIDSNPAYSYSTSGDNKVKLTVYDGDGFYCSYTESTTVTLPIPEWREIPPF